MLSANSENSQTRPSYCYHRAPLRLLFAVSAFLGTALSAVASPPSSPERSGKESADIQQYVAPELRHQPLIVPDDKNATPLLRKLSERLKKIDEAEFGPLYDAVHEAGAAGIPEPLCTKLRLFLKKHEEAFFIVDEMLRRGSLNFSNEREFTDHSINRFNYLSLFRFRLLAADGDLKTAAAGSIKELRLGKMFTDAEGATPFVLSRGLRTQTDGADLVLELAANRALSAGDVKVFMVALEETMPRNDLLEQSVRNHFHYLVLPEMNRLPVTDDAEKAVDWRIDKFRPKGTAPFDINGQLDKRRALVLNLLQNHPGPYLRSATIGTINQMFIEAIQESRRPWRNQRHTKWLSLAHELTAWPEPLSLDLLKIASLTFGNEQPSIGPDELAGARAQLAKVENVLGKHLIASDAYFDPYLAFEFYFRTRCKFEAARTLLALRQYALQHETLPPTLEALCNAKLLQTLPIDSFSGNVLRYSPEKRILWCIGPDGKDDGGTPEKRNASGILFFLRMFKPDAVSKLQKRLEPENVETGGDLVWNISNIP